MLNKSLIPQATENMLFSLSLKLLPALMEMSDTLVFYFTLFFYTLFFVVVWRYIFYVLYATSCFCFAETQLPLSPKQHKHTQFTFAGYVCYAAAACLSLVFLFLPLSERLELKSVLNIK